MIRTFLLTTLLGLSLCVGSTQAFDPFAFNVLPSAKSQALGNMGITEIHASSFSSNPATLAAAGFEGLVTFSANPSKTELGTSWDYTENFFGGSATLPVGSAGSTPSVCFGLGYFFTEFGYGEFVTTDASGNVLGTVDAFLRSHSFALSAAHRGAVDVSLGLTVRHWRAKLAIQGAGDARDAETSSSTAFDFGTHISRSFSMPSTSSWYVTPAIAATYHNLGSDIEFADRSVSATLPKAFRVGAEIELERRSPALTLYSVAPMIEWHCLTPGENESIYHYGARVAILETLQLRVAQFEMDWSPDQSTLSWGLSVSTRGLVKWRRHSAGSSDGRSVFDRLNVEVSYARYSDDYMVPRLGETKFLDIALQYDF